MKIELRNVKYAAFASEETSCFEAAIYIDGKREGRAHNAGKGGMTDIEPLALEARIDAYAATLPEIDLGAGLGKIKQTGETLVDDLLTQHLDAQDLKRALATRIVLVREGKVYQSRKMPRNIVDRDVEQMRATDSEAVLKRWNADYILNLCPFDEALRLYRAGAA